MTKVPYIPRRNRNNEYSQEFREHVLSLSDKELEDELAVTENVNVFKLVKAELKRRLRQRHKTDTPADSTQ